MSDHWDTMWDVQSVQQRSFNLDPAGMTELSRSLVAKDLALGLYEEASELIQVSTRYKAHILKSPGVDKGNIIDGVVDVLKYTIAIAQLYGITSENLFEAFQHKSNVVGDKARGERLDLERHTKVIVVDIDNCIADLSVWSNELDSKSDALTTGGLVDDKVVSVLENLKDDFYKGGGFRDLPVIPGAQEGMVALRNYGYKLVLITARPYWRYKRLYADTIVWLQTNDIVYDLILFNSDKAEAVYESVFPAYPAFFIEDSIKHALHLAHIGIHVLLVDWEYNRNVPDNKLITRVNGWNEIVDIVKSQ